MQFVAYHTRKVSVALLAAALSLFLFERTLPGGEPVLLEPFFSHYAEEAEGVRLLWRQPGQDEWRDGELFFEPFCEEHPGLWQAFFPLERPLEYRILVDGEPQAENANPNAQKQYGHDDEGHVYMFLQEERGSTFAARQAHYELEKGVRGALAVYSRVDFSYPPPEGDGMVEHDFFRQIYLEPDAPFDQEKLERIHEKRSTVLALLRYGSMFPILPVFEGGDEIMYTPVPDFLAANRVGHLVRALHSGGAITDPKEQVELTMALHHLGESFQARNTPLMALIIGQGSRAIATSELARLLSEETFEHGFYRLLVDELQARQKKRYPPVDIQVANLRQTIELLMETIDKARLEFEAKYDMTVDWDAVAEDMEAFVDEHGFSSATMEAAFIAHITHEDVRDASGKVIQTLVWWNGMTPRERAEGWEDFLAKQEEIAEKYPREEYPLINFPVHESIAIADDVAFAWENLICAAALILAEGDDVDAERIDEILAEFPDPYSQDGKFCYDPDGAVPFDLRSPGPSLEFHPEREMYQRHPDNEPVWLHPGDILFGQVPGSE